MFSLTLVFTPPSSYCARYVPGGRVGRMYSPLASVTAVRVPCNCGLVTVTVTPGSGLPCGSGTFPINAPVVGVVCANPKFGTSTSTNTRDTNVSRVNFFIHILLLDFKNRLLSAQDSSEGFDC